MLEVKFYGMVVDAIIENDFKKVGLLTQSLIQCGVVEDLEFRNEDILHDVYEFSHSLCKAIAIVYNRIIYRHDERSIYIINNSASVRIEIDTLDESDKWLLRNHLFMSLINPNRTINLELYTAQWNTYNEEY